MSPWWRCNLNGRVYSCILNADIRIHTWKHLNSNMKPIFVILHWLTIICCLMSLISALVKEMCYTVRIARHLYVYLDNTVDHMFCLCWRQFYTSSYSIGRPFFARLIFVGSAFDCSGLCWCEFTSASFIFYDKRLSHYLLQLIL